MYKNIRSDLALELNEDIRDDSVDNGIKISSVYKCDNKIKVTVIEIVSDLGAELLGKPKGTYITIEGDELIDFDEDIHKEFSALLSDNIKKLIGDSRRIFVIGLGNRLVTPDSLGPLVVDNLFITRHLLVNGIINNSIELSALSPGVMAQTGIETENILNSMCKKINPDIIIAIDALAAREPSRLGRTIQICDTGINPGAGVGNKRSRLDTETLGVKVIAIGVPTVISVPSIVNQIFDDIAQIATTKSDGKWNLLNDNEKNQLMCEVMDDKFSSMYVTPQNIDEMVKRVSYTISEAINSILEL